ELLDRGLDKESPDQFLSVVAIAAGSMTEEQYETVYKALIAQKLDEQHPKSFLSFLRNAAKANPESALIQVYDFALKHKDEDIEHTRDEVFDDALSEWHKADPDGALEWGLKKLDPEGKGGLGFEMLDPNEGLPRGFVDSLVFAATKYGGAK